MKNKKGEDYSIGFFIRDIRNQVKVSQKEICLGVCSLSTSTLSRIENGEKEPNKFIVDALFQRLGRTLNIIEIVYTKKI